MPSPQPSPLHPDLVADYESTLGPFSPTADPKYVLEQIRRLDPTAPLTDRDVAEYLSRKSA